MANQTDGKHIALFGRKALAAVMAVISCLYLSAGFMPSEYALADEVPPVTAEEPAGEDKKEEPESKPEPETKNESKGNGKEPEQKEPEKKDPEVKEPEEKPQDETTAETQAPDALPVEDPSENPAEQPSDGPSEEPSEGTEDKQEEKPSETQEETPSEDKKEEAVEAPAEPGSETSAETPSENEQQTDPESQPEPAEEIRYKLSGKGYLPKYKAKKATFEEGVLTVGKKGKRLEAFSISLKNETGYSGSINYRAYIRKKGWSKWVTSGKRVGTKRKNLRIEAVQIKLTGELAQHYYVEYKTTLSTLKDSQGWVRNSEIAGTRNDTKRVEVLQVRLVPIDINIESTVAYRLRGQSYGWQKYWSRDGAVSGTFSKYLDGLSIVLGPSKYPGGISYRSYLQDGKWTGWVSGGSFSGRKKKGKRIEALQIKLTGEMAEHYDVYYRVYVQSLGWLDWASNGQSAGSSGASRRIEKLQIVLREKETGEPGDLEGIISVKEHAFYQVSNTNAVMTYKNILDCGYSDPDVFRKKLISNFEYMKDVGYFHMGKMIQGYTDCAGSVSLAYRVALKTAKFTKKYAKGTRTKGADKYGEQLYGIGVNYCGIKSYKDKYGWCRNGTASVNSHFLNTIVKNRKIKYSHVMLTDRSDGVPGWSNDEWVDYLKQTGAKPGDIFVWFNHDWSAKKGQHMTMYAGIGEDGIAYEWTASSTYGVILSPLTDRSPQNIFESFALIKGVGDLNGSN